MAKPHLTLHFHCEETHGKVLDSAHRFAVSRGITPLQPFCLPGGRPPGKSLPALLRMAHSLGVPVLLSLSNERLLRAMSDPAERKALSDGVSRGRLLPTPVAAFCAELPILAPFEVADEIRLNIDLWKRALFTPPFAAQPECDGRGVVRHADPARACAAPDLVPAGKSHLLAIDLTPLELQPDPEQTLNRLGETLRNRKDFRLASPAASHRGWAEQALREILSGSLRFPTFSQVSRTSFDVRRHGFPLDLARMLADDSHADRVFAAFGDQLTEAEFDVARLEARKRHGLLLRRLCRSAPTDEIPHTERARASYLVAGALIASLQESVAAEAVIDPAAVGLAAQLKGRLRLDLERITEASAECPESSRTDSRNEQLLARVAGLLPASDGATPTRLELLKQLREVVLLVLSELDQETRSVRQGCHATA